MCAQNNVTVDRNSNLISVPPNFKLNHHVTATRGRLLSGGPESMGPGNLFYTKEFVPGPPLRSNISDKT
jgi:hypothetical protein